ncbi:MAG: hypothetical protein TECD_00867 [Hyphomicrobiaceae bacterium hypho_1]
MLFTVLVLIVFGFVAFIAGVARAKAVAKINSNAKMHSRIRYHGTYCLIWATIPALFATLVLSAATHYTIDVIIKTDFPRDVRQLSKSKQAVIMGQVRFLSNKIKNLRLYKDISARKAEQILKAKSVIVGDSPPFYIIEAAYKHASLESLSFWIIIGVTGAFSLVGLLLALARIQPRLKARIFVETTMMVGLILASIIAVLTTIGIVGSVLIESINFFQRVSLDNFYLGTVWDPRFTSADSNRGEGQFGFLPLLWGTFYISFVALVIAVPIGLYAAIYLSEYASSSFRCFAKPLLEILAGIPTIIYGFFALISFGPFLRDAGAMVGLNISSTSVLTAGMVMGIMIIPFMSSLSDDIISAIPQSLREGSYGLGATKSETIRRIILPAALPGIVGAVLLAASRAIGETMIVVLAAGIAANLTLNPFESVTTITVKIVSQLTGDLEFNSPQTLAAFALGLTLFVVTLMLNIYALYIVRRYKEQYD